MFSSLSTSRFTESFSEKTARLRLALEHADAVLVGAGAGLSTSAGFEYSGERFERYFADFRRRYGFSDMYSGGFYPYSSPEEFWAYWSRYILINRYADPPKPLYSDLLGLLEKKDYFVLTTNVDHCFQKAGFDKERLFYTQGDYGLFQCSEPCRNETWENEDAIRRMAAEQSDMKIPSELVPRCPYCGKPAATNLRSDDRFVEDAGWFIAEGRYEDFVRRHEGARVLLLELGVGYNTPGIIKYPFWRWAAREKDAFYVCINSGESYAPDEIADRSLCISADIGEVLSALKE